MPRISIAKLFEDNRDKLHLEWVAGRDSGGKELVGENMRDAKQGLIGHLNLLHPNFIQVLGGAEIGQMNAIDADRRHNMLQQLAETRLSCLFVSGGEMPPPALVAFADKTHTALFTSPIASMELMWLLRPYLARELAASTTMHGVMLDVLGMGVLITGDSGVGKSELALELISRGSGLIADDVVELYNVSPETLEGRCPPLLKDYLEVRGLGVLNIRTIFGEAALRPRKNLKLIVRLEKPGGPEVQYVERLPLKPGTENIMDVEVRKVTIPVAAGRNLAVLVEAAVRNYVLQLRGIDSTRDFIARQAQQLSGENW
jgi:HPr kinase/phosphorylase